MTLLINISIAKDYVIPILSFYGKPNNSRYGLISKFLVTFM